MKCKQIKFLLTLTNMVIITLSWECIWHPQNKTITSKYPVHRYENCLNYCNSMYQQKPQRQYYNETSRMCQPMIRCKDSDHYYYYPENKCYIDDNRTEQAQGFYPQKIVERTHLYDESFQIICMNGKNFAPLFRNLRCICQPFWEDSGKVDLNGFEFKCDKIVDDPTKLFYDTTIYDKEGNVIRYGSFTPQELQVTMYNLRKLERQQVMDYVTKNYYPVLYAMNEVFQEEYLIRDGQQIYVFLLWLSSMLLLGASYWENESLKIRVTRNQLKAKIIQVVTNPQYNIIRDIK